MVFGLRLQLTGMELSRAERWLCQYALHYGEPFERDNYFTGRTYEYGLTKPIRDNSDPVVAVRNIGTGTPRRDGEVREKRYYTKGGYLIGVVVNRRKGRSGSVTEQTYEQTGFKHILRRTDRSVF